MAENCTEWWPSRFFCPGKTAFPYDVLILNQPINEHALRAVINDATLVVCADGGANRLFDLSRTCDDEFSRVRVNAIVGDLDSLRPQVEEHFRRQGVVIEKDPDQDSTDFQKCLRWIKRHIAQPDILGAKGGRRGQVDVVAIGGLGGRVDQGFSQIHHLYLAQDDAEMLDGRIYLLSEQSLSFVLGAGLNVIHVDRDTFKENVGIIPVTGPALITTKGLEWDVKDWRTEFGGQMSTSNHIRSNQLDITFTGKRPLFTVELGDRFTAVKDG